MGRDDLARATVSDWGVALVTAAGLIAWHLFDRRNKEVRPDAGPVAFVYARLERR